MTTWQRMRAAALGALILSYGAAGNVTAEPQSIDDRSSDDLTSSLGTQWRLVTDQVMGGVSDGSLTPDSYRGRRCLQLQGSVSTANNGGFVQMALPLAADGSFDASAYTGIELEVAGNSERYNLHLRTTSLWLPWQSYRASFEATPEWTTVRIPFTELEAYRTSRAFRQDRLERIGLVAIGREFQADLCLAAVRLYQAESTD